MASLADHVVNNRDLGSSLRETDALLASPASGQGLREADRVRVKERDDPTGNMAQWAGTPHVKGSSESMRMALLTFSIIGLQYVYPTSFRILGHAD